jgi:hypothetical protein
MFQQALDKVSKQLLVRERYDNFIGGGSLQPRGSISTIQVS